MRCEIVKFEKVESAQHRQCNIKCKADEILFFIPPPLPIFSLHPAFEMINNIFYSLITIILFSDHHVLRFWFFDLKSLALILIFIFLYHLWGLFAPFGLIVIHMECFFTDQAINSFHLYHFMYSLLNCLLLSLHFLFFSLLRPYIARKRFILKSLWVLWALKNLFLLIFN